MINTGLRPSEITGLDAESDIVLDNPVPHVVVRFNENGTLKTEGSERRIPLIGVSLDAMRAIKDMGGCLRYRDKENFMSNTINKYLTENGLRETPRHVAYSLRHSMEDRMTDAGLDDRIRADILGHEYARPRYGEGGVMLTRLRWLQQVAIEVAGPADAAARREAETAAA